LDLYFENKKSTTQSGTKPFQYAIALLLILFVQIIYGAFVAGLKAGHIYNTWPKMGNEWIAESVSYAWAKDGLSSLFYNMASVQFIHRTTALILLIIFCLMWACRKNVKWNLSIMQCNALNIGLTAVVMQLLLGVFTLVYNVPIWLGVLHQAWAFVLLGAAVFLVHRLRPVY
jgi:cytochrome c oxidase assembly protein subunit 15